MSGPEPDGPESDGPAGGDRAALDRLLGTSETRWLVDRVRARVLAADDAPLSGVVQLRDPTPGQRSAAVRLIGPSRRSGATLRVDLAVVEAVLRRGPWPAGLADAVQTLAGPVVDRRAVREHEAAQWDAARARLLPAIERFPGATDRWNQWCATGGLKRAVRSEVGRSEAARTSVIGSAAVGAQLVDSVAAVLQLLPASGEPLAVLARRAVGDAHGLDPSRPLGRLATVVVAAAFLSDAAPSDVEPSPRDVWDAAGVVMSNVASTVLCLGVPGEGPRTGEVDRRRWAAATSTTLEAARAARMPVLLTLDQVRSGGVRRLEAHDVVHVCENPTIVEVVAQRGGRASVVESGSTGPVLVCTSGQPSTAVVELLDRLTAEGARCRYHGDFDWAGLRIAGSLGARRAWEPWRYTAADYRDAVREGRPSRRLTGRPATSPWDPDLADAMGTHGLAVEEEAVADLLASDLLDG